MKYFLIILIFAFIAAFIYRRVRPYLHAARQIRAAIKQAQSLPDANAAPFDIFGARRNEAAHKASAGEKLFHCRTCGVWTPASRAHREAFCSIECAHGRQSQGTKG